MNKVQKFVLIGFTTAITSIILLTIGTPAFAVEYANEKCGVSIQYPEDWKVENDDYKGDGLRSFVDIYPDSDEDLNYISISIWDISDYKEKTIEYLSEVATPLESDEIKTEIIENDIIQVGQHPAQKIAYSEEFQGYTTYIKEINILAYDKKYQISLNAEDEDKFYAYSSLVEEIADSIKISKPTFEGINC
jgi:hypothetical protein